MSLGDKIELWMRRVLPEAEWHGRVFGGPSVFLPMAGAEGLYEDVIAAPFTIDRKGADPVVGICIITEAQAHAFARGGPCEFTVRISTK